MRGSSLSSVIGSSSRFIKLQIEKFSLNQDEEKQPATTPKSQISFRATSSISHHRSNTVPSRCRKSNIRKSSIQKTPCSTPTEQPTDDTPQKSSSQPFSPSLLPSQRRRRIPAIDDPDEVESRTSSIVNRKI